MIINESNHHSATNPWSNIKLATLIVLLVALVFTSAYGTYRFFANKLVEETQENLLTSMAKIKVTQIERLLEDRYVHINLFAKQPTIQRALTDTNSSQWLAHVDASIADQVNTLDYHLIALCDTKLRIIAPSTAQIQLEHTELTALQTAIGNRRRILVDPYQLTRGSKIAYGIAQPIFADNNNGSDIVGAVYFRFNARNMLFPILEFQPTSSKSAESLIVRLDGSDIVFMSPLRFKPETVPTTLRLSVNANTLANRGLVNGEFGLLNGVDYRGANVIGVTQQIQGTPWVKVTKVDRVEIEHYAIVLSIIVFTVALILLLLLGVILRLFWRHRLLQLHSQQAAIYERYMVALRASIDGYMVVDQNYRILDCNPALSEITGYDVAELKTLGIADLEFSENLEQITTRGQQMAEHGRGRFASCWHRKDGTIIHVDISITMAGKHFLAFIQDITASKAAKDALVQNNARFDALVACIPVGVYVFRFYPDGNMGFDYVSPRFCAILGVNAESVLADVSAVFACTHPDDSNSLIQANTNAGKNLLPFHWEGRFIIYGEVRYIRIESNPSSLVDGGSLWHGMVADITERKAAETDLARSNAELAQFAYVASHDLRQPLRTINNYLTLLQRKLGANLDADSNMYLTFATEGAKRMDALILALLEYSRVGRLETQPETVELATVVDEAICNLELDIAEAAAAINIAPGLPIIMGYPEELVRLFQNLISNAIRYQAPGSRPQITLDWRNARHEQLIWVHDNGIGIAPKDYERAFGIFQRLVSREEYAGTGIGLAICRKIMEHHDGRIWIDSTQGQGSTFFMAFPKNLQC